MQPEIDFDDTPHSSLVVRLMHEAEKKPFGNMPESFTGKKLEQFYLPEKNAVVIGLGKKEEFKEDYLRRAGARAIKLASAYKIPAVHFLPANVPDSGFAKLAEGAFLANYSFDKYKADDAKFFRLKKISFPANAKKHFDKIGAAKIICKNTLYVRDLVSENSDIATPAFMESEARKAAKKFGLGINVMHRNDLRRLGMNLILAVGKASKSGPRLITLEYNGDKDSKDRVMIVGKGICFDTGGLDLKPRDSMLEMRMDMAGAATVLGIIKSAAELKLEKNIVGIMAVAENLIDAESYRPKDIIKSYSGKTVENMDTDAEGRLVLADALNYGAKKFNPKLIVEFSTLTGSVVGTLGSHVAGMFCTENAKVYCHKMHEAGLETYERVWELPLFEEYLDEVAGERSDFRSLGKTRYNGAIFGGAFLSKFVEEKPFIHIDIAGTAHIEEPKDYVPKDGTGFGVRLGIEFLRRI